MKFPDPPPKKTAVDTLTAVAAVIGLVLLAIPVLLVAVLVKMFVVTTLWSWYIVPHFGVAELPMVTAFGISLIFGYFMVPFVNHDDKRTWKEKLGTAVAAPVLFLLLGWIGTFFM